jgi:hypothetical protein
MESNAPPSNRQKLDLKREFRPLYSARTNVVEDVTPGTHRFLGYDGTGDPNTSPQFAAAVEALYRTAYHLKFTIRKTRGIDYGVMPLEGLWWSDDMRTFSVERKNDWNWTMMILQPDLVSPELFEESRAAVADKSGLDLRALRFENHREGPCVQILHRGPFSAEGPAVEKLHHWIESSGHRLTGKHHEIYLSDFRRAAPANWKTIIRQPYA